MIVSIASGKGGTGKTTVATSFALATKNSQLIDCDVEEPNAHIFLKPRREKRVTVSIPIPKVDLTKCNFCGKCAQICAYNALAVLNDRVLVFPHLCHGCGGCSLLCMQKAINEVDKKIGIVEIGKANGVAFVHGILNIGEVMAPPLVRAVKQNINTSKTVIIDAPPGTSCPVIEAIKGSDFCILVTEPTPFGLNDLLLAVEVVRKMKIPFGVVVNRADLGDRKVDTYCEEENIPVLMRIPFDREIAMSYSKGIPLVTAQPIYYRKFTNMFEIIKNHVCVYSSKGNLELVD
ncbi:(4Fe-4S)-binding protein [candidate division WOR_3 bacterium SM23_42]|uniref:(4Fe-4S)-binding protein n=1 Tax=candidate division WOR_3 bacterium SM23_42 TaxID=1703779 RepID=A0A0S8FUW7_UNCW3|nr:MAG: (4Fe-4S)-binding protein [candidate division WOR_3 bacterium SM23_42]